MGHGSRDQAGIPTQVLTYTAEMGSAMEVYLDRDRNRDIVLALHDRLNIDRSSRLIEWNTR